MLAAGDCLGIVAEIGRQALLLLGALLRALLGSLLGSFLLGHSTSSLKVRAAGSFSPHLAANRPATTCHKTGCRKSRNIRETCQCSRRANIPSARQPSHATDFQLLLHDALLIEPRLHQLSNFLSSCHSCRSNAVSTSSLYLPCASEIVKGKSRNRAATLRNFFRTAKRTRARYSLLPHCASTQRAQHYGAHSTSIHHVAHSASHRAAACSMSAARRLHVCVALK